MAAIEDVQAFWDDRARRFGAEARATLGEQTLRELEIRTMLRLLRRLRPRTVLDAGCGNGYSTKRYARRFTGIRFLGVDSSPEMIRAARGDRGTGDGSADLPGCPANCRFCPGDVLDPSTLPPGRFDLVITQRCIQNLPGYDLQRQAIANLRSKCAPRGRLLLMECSRDGLSQLQRSRRRLGLDPVHGVEPWHNTFLSDDWLVRDFGARITCFSSTYMFLAKVLHPRLAGLGLRLPAVGRFGYDRLYSIAGPDRGRAAAVHDHR